MIYLNEGFFDNIIKYVYSDAEKLIEIGLIVL